MGTSQACLSLPAPSSCPPLPIPHSALYPALPCLSTVLLPSSPPGRGQASSCPGMEGSTMVSLLHDPDAQRWLQALWLFSTYLFSRYPSPYTRPVLSPKCPRPGPPQIKTCTECLLRARLCSRSQGHSCEQRIPFLANGAHGLSGETENNQIITRSRCKKTTVFKCSKGEVHGAKRGQIRE